jgi:hypothetical protein
MLGDCPETSFALPALACRLSGLTPHAVRQLAVGSDAIEEPPVVRSVRVKGRFLVHIGDVLTAAGALAGSRHSAPLPRGRLPR